MHDQTTGVPYGYCHCGCGQKTAVSSVTSRRDGWVKGEPRRYIKGHNGRVPDDSGQIGYCACGCGERTTIARRTYSAEGAFKGQPMRYVRGHNRSSGPVSPSPYLVNGDGCWIWQRAQDGNGYGQLRVNGRLVSAHRFYYEQEHGATPDGLELDHLCETPLCCNPDHLEPVTHQENCRRGRRWRR